VHEPLTDLDVSAIFHFSGLLSRALLATFVSTSLLACGDREQEVEDGADAPSEKGSPDGDDPLPEWVPDPDDSGLDALSYDSQGAAYLDNELIVGLNANVTAEELQAVLGEFGMTIAGADSLVEEELGFVRVVLPEDMDETTARGHLKTAQLTYSVDRHYVYEIEEQPNDPSYSALWGMEKIEAPRAWDTTTGERGIPVMILDTGSGLVREHGQRHGGR